MSEMSDHLDDIEARLAAGEDVTCLLEELQTPNERLLEALELVRPLRGDLAGPSALHRVAEGYFQEVAHRWREIPAFVAARQCALKDGSPTTRAERQAAAYLTIARGLALLVIGEIGVTLTGHERLAAAVAAVSFAALGAALDPSKRWSSETSAGKHVRKIAKVTDVPPGVRRAARRVGLELLDARSPADARELVALLTAHEDAIILEDSDATPIAKAPRPVRDSAHAASAPASPPVDSGATTNVAVSAVAPAVSDDAPAPIDAIGAPFPPIETSVPVTAPSTADIPSTVRTNVSVPIGTVDTSGPSPEVPVTVTSAGPPSTKDDMPTLSAGATAPIGPVGAPDLSIQASVMSAAPPSTKDDMPTLSAGAPTPVGPVDAPDLSNQASVTVTSAGPPSTMDDMPTLSARAPAPVGPVDAPDLSIQASVAAAPPSPSASSTSADTSEAAASDPAAPAPPFAAEGSSDVAPVAGPPRRVALNKTRRRVLVDGIEIPVSLSPAELDLMDAILDTPMFGDAKVLAEAAEAAVGSVRGTYSRLARRLVVGGEHLLNRVRSLYGLAPGFVSEDQTS